MIFTDKVVKALKPKTSRYEVWEDGRPGFGLRVAPTGRKTWVFVYRFDGAPRRMQFGAYPAKGLADAHLEHAAAAAELEKGIDPGAKKQTAKQARKLAPTIEDLVGDYITKWAKPRKRSWEEDERQLEKDVVRAWGPRKAEDITRREVRVLIEEKAAAAPIAANRLLACVRRMFNWAVEQDILEHSPATRIKAPAKENRKERVLTPDEIRAFWNATEGATEEIRRALKLILATGQRPGEVIGARWEEFDLEGGWWTIPSERAKNGQAHRVPLSPLARRLLGVFGKGYLFPSPAGKEPTSMNPTALARATGRHARMEPLPVKSKSRGIRKRHKPPVAWEVEPFTPHDLRRTAASLMTGIGVSRLVVSKILNHAERGVTAVYDRHSYDMEKRDALVRWGAHLEQIAAGEKAVVVPIRRGAKA